VGGYSIVRADDVEDSYADSEVPGEFRTGSVVRVAPGTTRSHRNEGAEPVEIWAVSRKIDEGDATKVEDFWEPSASAARQAEPDG
jgi:hypothetical protein